MKIKWKKDPPGIIGLENGTPRFFIFESVLGGFGMTDQETEIVHRRMSIKALESLAEKIIDSEEQDI